MVTTVLMIFFLLSEALQVPTAIYQRLITTTTTTTVNMFIFVS